MARRVITGEIWSQLQLFLPILKNRQFNDYLQWDAHSNSHFNVN